MALLPMSPQVFSILSALVADHCGLHFDSGHAPVFGEKVSARAVEAGFESLLDYYYFLRYDAGGSTELERLVESLVVGETYLFRELAPLEIAVSDIIAPLVGGGRRRPRIWCAACATGEEPHTVAMLLAARGILGDIDLVASDVSAASLDRARGGRFGRRAVRSDIPAFALPWVRVGEQGATVDSSLTKAIDWRQVNLIDDATVERLGTFDVILCRNVLIYFADETARQVVDRLGRRLNPSGALIVGISESLLRFNITLRCEEQSGIFLYKRSS